MDNGINDAWQLIMEASLSSINKFLNELSIPTIHGKLHGSGHTFIDAGSTGYLQHKQALGSKFTIAVLDINKTDQDAEDISSVTLYLRVGEGNVWLYSSISNVLLEDGYSDEDEYDNELLYDEPDLEVMSEISYLLAADKSYSAMKNKNQRAELAKGIIAKSGLDISECHVREIASRSESIFEFGVLPKEARKLIANGQSTLEASKTLGVTKARLEKALAMQAPGHIEELIFKHSNAAD